MRKLQRAMERSRQATNPDNYETVEVVRDEENPDDEKNEVEAYDAEINEIAPDDLGEEVELNEEDDDYSDEDTETEEEE